MANTLAIFAFNGISPILQVFWSVLGASRATCWIFSSIASEQVSDVGLDYATMRAIWIVAFDVVVDAIQYPIYLGLKIVVLQLLGLILINEFQKMLVLWST